MENLFKSYFSGKKSCNKLVDSPYKEGQIKQYTDCVLCLANLATERWWCCFGQTTRIFESKKATWTQQEISERSLCHIFGHFLEWVMNVIIKRSWSTNSMCLPAIKSCFGFVFHSQKLPAEISMWRFLGTMAKLFLISAGRSDPNVPLCSTLISFYSCQYRTQPEIKLGTYLMEWHMLKREMCGFSSVMFQNITMCCSSWLTRGHNIVYTLDLAFLHFHHIGLNWLYKNHKKKFHVLWGQWY